jgi:GNAT superfamily N-acetyltransferase
MRDRLLDFELELDERANEEVVAYDWGRAFLSPSLPLAWDANWALIERAGMTAAEVIAAADESLAAYEHRAIAIGDETEGTKLAPEIAAIPGWEAEENLYMLWRGDGGGLRSNSDVLETPLSGCEDLRRELIRGELPADLDKLEETTDQLLEMGRRCGGASGDRWFVAPPEQPASACCLLSGDGIGQVEDVGTLASARRQGLAKAAIQGALAASREAGHEHTFIVADADDWPRLLYEKLGFEPCGVLHVLRRAPTAGTTA